MSAKNHTKMVEIVENDYCLLEYFPALSILQTLEIT